MANLQSKVDNPIEGLTSIKCQQQSHTIYSVQLAENKIGALSF